MKVSIIIPVYNAVAFIPRCVEALKSQTMKDFEVIFVDDCSQDASVTMLERVCARDARMKLIVQKENHGPMIARRTGTGAARGEYVFYADVDDILPSKALEGLLTREADIIIGQCVEQLPSRKMRDLPQSLPYGDDKLSVYRALINRKITCALWGKLIRRSLLEKDDFEYIDGLKYGEDFVMYLQIIERASTYALVGEKVYIYRYEPESLSNIKTKEQLLGYIRAYSWKLNFLAPYAELKKDLDRDLVLFMVSRMKEGLSVNDIVSTGGFDLKRYFEFGSLRTSFSFWKASKLYFFYHLPWFRKLYGDVVYPLRKRLHD